MNGITGIYGMVDSICLVMTDTKTRGHKDTAGTQTHRDTKTHSTHPTQPRGKILRKNGLEANIEKEWT